MGNGSRINRPVLGKRGEHMADVTVAMLYLACGGTGEYPFHCATHTYRYKSSHPRSSLGLDEAHDLVLPHSWSSYTPQGGDHVENTEVATEAKYCHALVHRCDQF